MCAVQMNKYGPVVRLDFRRCPGSGRVQPRSQDLFLTSKTSSQEKGPGNEVAVVWRSAGCSPVNSGWESSLLICLTNQIAQFSSPEMSRF